MPSSFAHGAIDQAGRVETVARRPLLELASNEHLRLVGWAAAKQPTVVFEKVYFVIDDALWLPVPYGAPRPDTAAILPNGSLAHSGFDVTISTRHIRPGMHSLAVVGTIGDREQQLAARVTFIVLAKPELAHEIGPRQDGQGRIRVLRDTLPQHRDDGRSPSAVRRGASLLVEGWAMSVDARNVPDETRLLLVGPARRYRVGVQRRTEPEAGVLFGVDAIHSGYRACIDCAQILPGAYEIWIERRRDRSWTSSPTGRYVEIMEDAKCWLPSALPIYQSTIESSFDVPLPTQIARNGEFFLTGKIHPQAQILGVFARFDNEQTFALTSSEVNGSGELGKLCYTFTGLLQPRLSLGDHVLELLVLDSSGAGAWRFAHHPLSLVEYELSGAALQGTEAVAKL